ncbi:DDE Tnp4 domain-containing protein [Aphis craccivora]|uniref:DDE Tnp4 domain-containing protein n=1 Tax=Aphis craccivora TaxID=307492 RepID=A0A6G0Y4A3_APHCR|nr:DDE Tnp4 domain-containing protein [Aphis craccivora]
MDIWYPINAVSLDATKLNQNSQVCAHHFNPNVIISTWKSDEGSSQYLICLRSAKAEKRVIPSIFPLDLAYNIYDKVNDTLVTSILEEQNYCNQKRNLLCLNLVDDFIAHNDVSETQQKYNLIKLNDHNGSALVYDISYASSSSIQIETSNLTNESKLSNAQLTLQKSLSTQKKKTELARMIQELIINQVSYLLAMKHLKEKHSYDVTAFKSMESVYTELDINHKTTFSTTDNGSNCVKSFKVYNKNYDQNIFNLDSSVNKIIDDGSNDEFELQVTNYENILQEADD